MQVLRANPNVKSFGQRLNEGIGSGIDTLKQFQQQAEEAAKQKKFADEVKRLYNIDVSGMSREGGEKLATEAYKQKAKFQNQQDLIKQFGLGEYFGEEKTPQEMPQPGGMEGQENAPEKDQPFDWEVDELVTNRPKEDKKGMPQPKDQGKPSKKLIPENKIAAMALVNKPAADVMQKHNDRIIEEQKRSEDIQRKEFSEERKFHSGYTKDLEKDIDQRRESLDRRDMALDFARNAVESGNTSFFSFDKLADITGSDVFRTAKGAQLITAGKENLLSNMGRVSARAQNIWFEQRLNSMFPKIGQSDEANLTVQEMLEGETAMERAYIDEFDRLVAEDEEKYGFAKKDIAKRAKAAVKPYEKEIMDRTSFRLKELEEKEKGLSAMKKEVGKNVVKGTPLTLEMAQLYLNKFGREKALKMAEKNGYTIPTTEQYSFYNKQRKELREEME